MDLRDLIYAVNSHDPLAAREWMLAANRAQLRWSDIPEPQGLDPSSLAIAAGLVETLAQRAGQEPPAWTAGVPAAQGPIFLVQAAHTMPRLRRLCETDGPEPLRRRGIFAPPDYLTAA